MIPGPDPVLGLLLGRLAPGVWSADRVPFDVATQAIALGWRVAEVALTGSKVDDLVALGEAAGFPDYARPNWDATADALTDLALAPGDRMLVVLTGVDPDGAVVPMLTDVLAEAADRWAHLHVQLATLLVGLSAPSARRLADI